MNISQTQTATEDRVCPRKINCWFWAQAASVHWHIILQYILHNMRHRAFIIQGKSNILQQVVTVSLEQRTAWEHLLCLLCTVGLGSIQCIVWILYIPASVYSLCIKTKGKRGQKSGKTEEGRGTRNTANLRWTCSRHHHYCPFSGLLAPPQANVSIYSYNAT